MKIAGKLPIAASLVIGGCAVLTATDDVYSVSILGDMHYDVAPKETYHSRAIELWAKNNTPHPSRLLEFDRNARMWQDICKRILAASAECVRPDAAFMLQLGDLVQGDCENNELHKRMLKEATDLLVATYPKLPIVTVCGNHDIREGHNNSGAWKPYAEQMTRFESEQLSELIPGGVTRTTFGFRRGKDLWIFMDFNFGARDVGIVKRLLDDNPDVRYTFVCSHGPVLPMQIWRTRWFYLGYEQDDRLRREMRAIFAKRNVIVLAGHVHSLEKTVWEGDGGSITEMVLNSCAFPQSGECFPSKPHVVREGVERYGEFPYRKEEAKERKLLEKLYEEYRPGIRELYNSKAVGHYILRVSDKSVELDYYGHDAHTPTKTFSLR